MCIFTKKFKTFDPHGFFLTPSLSARDAWEAKKITANSTGGKYLVVSVYFNVWALTGLM